MEGNVRNLEEKMAAGFRLAVMQRKKDYDDLEVKMMAGFKNEEKREEEGL